MLDLTGHRYGRWTVNGPAPKRGKHIMWACRCDCGTERNVLGFTLKQGQSTGCGCERTARNAARRVTHGMWRHAAYWSWKAMNDRCTYPSHTSWHLYGGRGIKVCEAWKAFAGFWGDMGASWFPGATIDRFPDKNGDYEPGNCRWATRKGQARNRRDNLAISTSVGVITLTEASEVVGIKRHTLDSRRRYGFDEADLFRPVQDNTNPPRDGAGRFAKDRTSQPVVTRKARIETSDGSLSVAQAARRAGLNVKTVRMRMRRGWPMADLLKPVEKT